MLEEIYVQTESHKPGRAAIRNQLLDILLYRGLLITIIILINVIMNIGETFKDCFDCSMSSNLYLPNSFQF